MFLARDPAALLASNKSGRPYQQTLSPQEYWFGFGRLALHQGLKALELKPGDVIFLPDTICDVVLSAIMSLKLTIMYYAVKEDFTANWDQLNKLQQAFHAKAFLGVHYFGFANQVDLCRRWCDGNYVYYIEDNAHGYGATHNGKLLGSFGDIGFASPRKTMPAKHGAVLWVNNSKLNRDQIQTNHPLQKVAIKSRAKDFIKSCLIKVGVGISRFRNKPDFSQMPPSEENQFLSYGLSQHEFKKIHLTNLDKVRKIRHEIYSFWNDFLTQQGLAPVFEQLSPESMPLIYPCYAKNHAEQIKWLEWGFSNDVDVYPWPSLPLALRANNNPARQKWQRLLCFPINHEIALNHYQNVIT